MKNSREDDPQWINCNKDTATRFMQDGTEVETIRFHCDSTAHRPIVWQQRIAKKTVEDKNFVIPNCPFCKRQLVRGGVKDFDGICLKGPA